RIQRRLLPAPARGLLGEAGPPQWWVLAAFAAATVLAWLLTVQRVATPVIALVAVAVVTVPAIFDVDGWRIRLGMAWLGAEQRRRIGPRLPRTPRDADRQLDRPDPAASVFQRASL